MAQQTLDIPTFRLLFPEFVNPTSFPDAYIQAQWDVAVSHMGDLDGWALAGAALRNALNYLTAHLMKINVMLSSGGGGTLGVVTSATEDKVSVSFATPPVRSGWQQWLASTPYGLQLWALLQMKSAGGLYIGGRPERRAFRKVGGNFLP